MQTGIHVHFNINYLNLIGGFLLYNPPLKST
jgi:hypothetical protein